MFIYVYIYYFFRGEGAMKIHVYMGVFSLRPFLGAIKSSFEWCMQNFPLKSSGLALGEIFSLNVQFQDFYGLPRVEWILLTNQKNICVPLKNIDNNIALFLLSKIIKFTFYSKCIMYIHTILRVMYSFGIHVNFIKMSDFKFDR